MTCFLFWAFGAVAHSDAKPLELSRFAAPAIILYNAKEPNWLFLYFVGFYKFFDIL